MSSREKILEAITKNKPAPSPLPEINVDALQEPADLMQRFITTLQGIGGTVVKAGNLQIIKDDLQESLSTGLYVVNTIEALGITNAEVNLLCDAVFLEPVDRAYISGTMGIAENGAIWLEEGKMLNRLLPFICQHLVLVLDAATIVANMHEAYKKITIDQEGYGVFLAGPSKTADIEQSLVIGAHGAKSLKVYLVNWQ